MGVLFTCVCVLFNADDINLIKGKIVSKQTINDLYSEYEINGNGDLDLKTQIITAEPDFAKVGDWIASKDGVIKIVKKENNESNNTGKHK